MAILDFFKKKPQNEDDQDAVSPVSDNASTQTPAVVERSETMVSSGSTGPYNGIGMTPSGAQPYNGIGTPPSGAQPYNGIGTPPGTTQPYNTSVGAPAPTPLTPATPAADADMTKKPDANAPQSTDKQATDSKPANTDKLPSTDGIQSHIDTDKRSQLDLMTHLTQRSNRVFMTGQQKAQELKAEYIDTEHVLHGLLADPEIYKLFTDNKVPPQTVETELEAVYKKGETKTSPVPSPRVKRILDNALVIARKLGYDFISPEHILLALYDEGEGAGSRILAKLGIKKEDLNKKITGKKEGLTDENGKPVEGSTSQSILSQYTKDLTSQAESGQLDPVVERSDVIERTIHIISRRTKNNPVLVGEAGVGKTAVVEGLAQKITTKEVPESLLGKRILQLDLMAILAGASHRGEFEERMKKIIEEISASNGQIILFIDEIHNIVGAGAGGNGSLDASNFLKPSLARGELQMIGATTLTEYRKYIEKDPALERRFQPVLVPEPTPEAAVKMLKALKDKYEAFHRVQIPDEAVESAVLLSKRYVGDRFLPDKAIDLIDEAASAVRLPLISLPEEIRSHEERLKQLQQELDEVEKRGDKVRSGILRPKIDDLQAELKAKQEDYGDRKSQTTTSVSEQSIKDIISRWTGIPISKITESETEKLTKLEDIIHERLINQNNAVEPVAQAVRRGRAGLKSTDRPIGSFVFLGPTGVGKTELSKTLAEVLFGQEEAMIRFDMTEYMEKHEVAKLLGAPPGYVGYEEGGKLTEAVRRRPYAVVLFDEVEKAHPDIFNILLQILDDGRLTDNKGHVVSFKNTVVICTSNIGTKLIQDEILAGGETVIEEPTLLTTYAFSPRGRQIMTIMGKVFVKEDKNAQWSNMMLLDYFAGQKIEEVKQIQTADGKTQQVASESKVEFPGKEFDTHAMSVKGIEEISVGDRLYMRNATTAKVWNTVTLIDYFKDGVVTNALPDAPEQQLPTARLKTHSFTPSDEEVVTFGDRYWKRKTSDKNWQTGTLKEYFNGHTLAGADAKQATDSAPNQKDTEDKQNLKKPNAKALAFPTSYWDIHGFTSDNNEFIIVGDTMWTRATSGNTWKTSSLREYFGSQFPLDKEVQEKEKIENELATNQYGRIKTKVMGELGKYFRPELINRFDEVIIFEPLKYKHMLEIAELQLKGLRKLMEDQNIGFSWSEPAKKEIVRQGFDPIFGARPLKRTIQKLVENPISTLIIEKKVDESDLIFIDFDGENFLFNIEHVSFVPADKVAAQKKQHKKFRCINSKHEFETDVVPYSTVICPEDGSDFVEEVTNESRTSDVSPIDEKEQTSDATQDTKETLSDSGNKPMKSDDTQAAIKSPAPLPSDPVNGANQPGTSNDQAQPISTQQQPAL